MTRPFLAAAATLSPDVVALLQRGHAGDLTALPEIRRVFDEDTELVGALGDLAAHAEEAVLGLIAGASVTGREAARRHLGALRDELLAEATSPLERLLCERVALSQLWVGQAELDLAGRLASGGGDSPGCRESQRRLDAAHRRLLSACRALAWSRKLLARRPPSPLELLGRPVPESKGEAGLTTTLAGRLGGVLS